MSTELSGDDRDELATAAMKVHQIQKVAESFPGGFFSPSGLRVMRTVRQKLNQLRHGDVEVEALSDLLDYWGDEDEDIFTIIHDPRRETALLRQWLIEAGFPEYAHAAIHFGDLEPKAKKVWQKFFSYLAALTLVHEDWWVAHRDVGEVYLAARER